MPEDMIGPDPERDDYLEQLQDAANIIDFLDEYGFEHNCHCATDWDEGRVGLVSECYTEMCNDALDTCRRMKGELAGAVREADRLRTQLREADIEPVV